MRAGCAARAAGTLSRGEGPGPQAAQAGPPNPWPGRRTGVVRGSWAVLSRSGGAASGGPRPVLTISLSKNGPGHGDRSARQTGTENQPQAALLSFLVIRGAGRMVHPRGGSRGGRLSGLLRTIRSRARQDRRRNRGRCWRPAKTRGAAGAEGDPGPARGRSVQRRCPAEGRSGRRRVVAIAVTDSRARGGRRRDPPPRR